MLGGPLEQGGLAQLLQASSGNPGCCASSSSGARDAGNLESARQRVGAGPTASRYVSPTLEVLVEERLGDLSEPETEAVELLSVGGHRRSWPSWQGSSVRASLERLEGGASLVVSSAGAGPRWPSPTRCSARSCATSLPVLRGRRIRRRWPTR